MQVAAPRSADERPAVEDDSLRPENRSIRGVSLHLVENYLELGAVELAHRVLSDHMPPRDDAGEWVEWEKMFYQTALRVRAWQSIIDRAGGLATDLPLDLFKISQTAAIQSEIELRRGEAARLRARHMMWNTPYDIEFALKWRDLVIQSYLSDQLYDDMSKAMAVFSRDFRPNDPQWEQRYARILLLTGNREQAISRIAGLQTVEAKMLSLYSQFIEGSSSNAAIVEDGLELLPSVEQDSALAAELWAIIRVVSSADQDTETRVVAAENGLLLHQRFDDANRIDPVVRLTTTFDLLEAYDEHAVVVGNSYGLIVGDDEQWFQKAREFEILAPATARAMYAFLSVNAAQSTWRQAAAESLATALMQAEFIRILELLVVEEKFIRIEDMSIESRTAIVNWTLQRKDFQTAWQILFQMSDPPDEVEPKTWNLRRARIAILAGDIRVGKLLLRRLVRELQAPLDGSFVDRVVQVIFDLQDLEEHRSAIELTGLLYEKSSDNMQKRELLHWSAESHAQLEHHVTAANQFLRSAAIGEDWNDDWGRSVQYRGAVELMKAGLYGDARRILTTLKGLSFDPRTRVVIDDRLRELSELERQAANDGDA